MHIKEMFGHKDEMPAHKGENPIQKYLLDIPNAVL
jgi:hypothetical protein